MFSPSLNDTACGLGAPPLGSDAGALESPLGIKDHTAHYDRYWAYIYERQLIWHKRYQLKFPPPWTIDSVLGSFAFTNVYRELDRGTLYYFDKVLPLLNNMRDDRGFTERALLVGTILYRFFNRWQTWEEVIAPALKQHGFDWDKIEEGLRLYKDGGEPVFTSAHMVCAYHTSPGSDKINKVIRFLRHIDAEAGSLLTCLRHAGSPFEAWRQLTLMQGIGPFNAYEVYSDFMYTPGFLPYQEDDWANAGPGAQRGLKLIWPGRKDWTKEMYQLRDEQQEAFARLGLPFERIALKNGDGSVRWLTMRNVEHNLCEYFKYNRGSCRTKFNAMNRGTHQ